MDFIVTTSENATVMPPPVKGWRMLNASPSNTAPGVRDGLAGIVLFRIDLNAPFFTAARSGSRSFAGTCGAIFVRTYSAIAPDATDGMSTCAGMSTRHRTSQEEMG
jgi:hypothetical protein